MKQWLVNGDDYLMHRHLDRFLMQNVDPSMKDFNFDRFSARDVEVSRIQDAVMTLPMMAEFRTVIVDDFESFNKDALTFLEPLIERDDLPSHLILISAKADKRTTFYKKFCKKGEFYEFKKPYPNQIPDILRDEAKAMKLNFESGSLEQLVRVGGSDLRCLVNEMKKLALFAHPQTQITRRHVDDLAVQGVVDNVFALGECLGKRDYLASSSLFRRIAEQGEPVIRLTALAIGHFRKILLARDAIDSKLLRAEWPAKLGVPPFFVKDYEQQASRFSSERLKGVYGGLMRLSEDLRTTSAASELLFEKFLVEVCLG